MVRCQDDLPHTNVVWACKQCWPNGEKSLLTNMVRDQFLNLTSHVVVDCVCLISTLL